MTAIAIKPFDTEARTPLALRGRAPDHVREFASFVERERVQSPKEATKRLLEDQGPAERDALQMLLQKIPANEMPRGGIPEAIETEVSVVIDVPAETDVALASSLADLLPTVIADEVSDGIPVAIESNLPQRELVDEEARTMAVPVPAMQQLMYARTEVQLPIVDGTKPGTRPSAKPGSLLDQLPPDTVPVLPQLAATIAPDAVRVAPELAPTPDTARVPPELAPTPDTARVIPELAPTLAHTPDAGPVLPELLATPVLARPSPHAAASKDPALVATSAPTRDLERVVPAVFAKRARSTSTPHPTQIIPEVTPAPALVARLALVTPNPETARLVTPDAVPALVAKLPTSASPPAAASVSDAGPALVAKLAPVAATLAAPAPITTTVPVLPSFVGQLMALTPTPITLTPLEEAVQNLLSKLDDQDEPNVPVMSAMAPEVRLLPLQHAEAPPQVSPLREPQLPVEQTNPSHVHLVIDDGAERVVVTVAVRGNEVNVALRGQDDATTAALARNAGSLDHAMRARGLDLASLMTGRDREAQQQRPGREQRERQPDTKQPFSLEELV